MENKHTGRIILFFVLMYITSAGQLLEVYYRAGLETASAFWDAFLNLLIISAIMMAVPFFCKVVKGKKLPYKGGKALCVWNSVLLFILPILLGQSIIGGIGAIFFYFINKWTFVDAPNAEGDNLKNNPNRMVKCKACGYQNKTYFDACPKCGKLAKQVVNPAKNYAFNCKFCGYGQKKAFEICPNCGGQVNKELPAKQSQQVEAVNVSFCRKCGTKLAEGSNFCGKCGTKVLEE